MRVFGVENNGVHELFVNSQKVNDHNFHEAVKFLKPFTFIVKSDDVMLMSSREELLNSKETVKVLHEVLIKKIIEYFYKLEDTKILKDYANYIKAGYLNSEMKEFTDIIPFKSTDGYKKVHEMKFDSKFYTTATPLPEGLHHPLFDGVNETVVFANSVIDEQVLMKMMAKNLTAPKDTEKTESKIAHFMKNLLKVEVERSKTLRNVPLRVTRRETVPENIRKLLGENPMFEKGDFKSKIICEINENHEIIRKLEDLITEDEQKAKGLVFSMYLATCLACDIQPTVADNYVGLMNIVRNEFNLEEFEIKEEEKDEEKEEEKEEEEDKKDEEKEEEKKDEEKEEKIDPVESLPEIKTEAETQPVREEL